MTRAINVALALSLLVDCTPGSERHEHSAPVAVAASTSPDRNANEESFMAENASAMTKMMSGMTVKPSGDVDRDFVAMMVPHHQGAIDMAVLELRYGHNERLRRLAQEIIVTQQEEIAAMDLAIGEALPPSVTSPTVPPPGPTGAAR